MDRHAVAVTLFGTLFAGGIAAMVGATAVPANSPYFDVLLWGGIVAIAIGLIGLILLMIFPGKKPPEPEHIDQSVTSHGQSGGITARNINAGDDERR